MRSVSLSPVEDKDRDAVLIIDLRDVRRESARLDGEPHCLLRCLRHRLGERFLQTQVVDHEVHGATMLVGQRRMLCGTRSDVSRSVTRSSASSIG